MNYCDIEVNNVTDDTPVEYIDKALELNDINLSKAILDSFLEGQKAIKNTHSDNLDDFLNHNNSMYTWNYGNCPFVLRLTGFTREIFVILLVNTIFRQNIESLNILADIVRSLLCRISYVKDYQLCVYYQAVKWQSNHHFDTPFGIEDILPQRDCPYREKINAYLEEDKLFCSLYIDEYCDASIGNYRDLLNSLCKDGVLESLGNDKYKFIF